MFECTVCGQTFENPADAPRADATSAPSRGKVFGLTAQFTGNQRFDARELEDCIPVYFADHAAEGMRGVLRNLIYMLRSINTYQQVHMAWHKLIALHRSLTELPDVKKRSNPDGGRLEVQDGCQCPKHALAAAIGPIHRHAEYFAPAVAFAQQGDTNLLSRCLNFAGSPLSTNGAAGDTLDLMFQLLGADVYLGQQDLDTQVAHSVESMFAAFPGTQQIAVMYNAAVGDLAGMGHVVSMWRLPSDPLRFRYYDPFDEPSAPFAADDRRAFPGGSFATAILTIGVPRTLFALSLPPAFANRKPIRERFDTAVTKAFARLPFNLVSGAPQTDPARRML
jgi:hypothetical protein